MSPPTLVGRHIVFVLSIRLSVTQFVSTTPLKLQNSFKINGTQAEQFSGMGNFAMTIWNSTCNPCFSTFDQFFFVFHGLRTGFFCYSLKLNFICYPNRLFTYDYSLWDEGRHTFLRAKTNFNFDIKSSFVHFVLPFSIKGPRRSPLLFICRPFGFFILCR